MENKINDIRNMALFCDFENLALGVRDAKYDRFDMNTILERLLTKGNIVVKKAYCDWTRYQEFKGTLHEVSFELIEVPHVRQSGKNSADIRLVVDALDLCYTKSHVDTFVILSGDSDFSPLVSKLRENNKRVIGIGVKKSTSDLLTANCDEFIYYDDLVRVSPGRPPAAGKKRKGRTTGSSGTQTVLSSQDKKKKEAWDLLLETYLALLEERGGVDKIRGSMVKQTLKRRKPGFSESYYGYRSFNELLEDARAHGVFELSDDVKTGDFTITR